MYISKSTITKASMAAFSLGAGAAVIMRRADWTNKSGGNTHIDIGDNKVNYGPAPPWDVFDKLKDHCTSDGCNSDNVLEYDSSIVQDGEAVGAKIQVHAEGTFNQAPKDGSLDQMVELVKAAAGNGPYNVNKGVKYRTGDGCASFAGPTPCDPGNEESQDEYHLTDTINVRTTTKNDGTTFLNVYVTIDVDDSDSGVCSDLTTVGSAVAGAINGIAGGIFSLAGLFCS